MARSHGSCQACYFGQRPASGTCDKCAEYSRTRRRRELRTPGTYAFNGAHGIGRAGQVTAARDRKYKGSLKGILSEVRHVANQRGTR